MPLLIKKSVEHKNNKTVVKY